MLSLLSFRQPPGMTTLDARASSSGPLRFLAVWKGAIAVTLAFISAIATFLILTGLTPFNPTPQTVVGLLVVCLFIHI